MGVLVILIGLIASIVPIAIVIIIISAILKKSKESTNNFSETIRSIYVYVILIITLVAIIVGTITTFRVGLDIILPEKSTYQNRYNDDEWDRNQRTIEFFTTLSLVISSIPVYIYHNKLAKKHIENKVEEINN